MATYGLPATCVACGGELALVQSTANRQGTEAAAVLSCSGCRVEWMVAMQMRRMPRPPKMSPKDPYRQQAML